MFRRRNAFLWQATFSKNNRWPQLKAWYKVWLPVFLLFHVVIRASFSRAVPLSGLCSPSPGACALPPDSTVTIWSFQERIGKKLYSSYFLWRKRICALMLLKDNIFHTSTICRSSALPFTAVRPWDASFSSRCLSCRSFRRRFISFKLSVSFFSFSFSSCMLDTWAFVSDSLLPFSIEDNQTLLHVQAFWARLLGLILRAAQWSGTGINTAVL